MTSKAFSICSKAKMSVLIRKLGSQRVEYALANLPWTDSFHRHWRHRRRRRFGRDRRTCFPPCSSVAVTFSSRSAPGFHFKENRQCGEKEKSMSEVKKYMASKDGLITCKMRHNRRHLCTWDVGVGRNSPKPVYSVPIWGSMTDWASGRQYEDPRVLDCNRRPSRKFRYTCACSCPSFWSLFND